MPSVLDPLTPLILPSSAQNVRKVRPAKPKTAKIAPQSPPATWALAVKIRAFCFDPSLVHPHGRCTKGYWWVCNTSLPLSGPFRPKPLPPAHAQVHATEASLA